MTGKQYQVYKKSNHELVAWIDTKANEQVVQPGYDIIMGDNLTTVESEDILLKIRCKFFDKTVYPDGLQKIGGNRSDWIDLRAAEDVTLKKGEVYYIPLGVAIELPKGYEALVAPRSSTPKNFFVIMANSIGVIDETFRGDNDQWCMPAYAIQDTEIKKGERICQFRIIEHQPEIEFEVVDHLGNEDRGGWGTSGKK